MSGAHYLAIDLGTSGVKAGVVTERGAIVGHAFAATKLRLLPGGGAEQSPDDWWQALVAASRYAIASSGLQRTAIAAVSVTAQWSGTVALDAAGNSIGEAIIWMDARGRKQIATLCGGFPSVDGYNVWRMARWLRLTGGGPGLGGKDSLAHVLYLRDEQPEAYARTRTFLEPKDYLNFRLTGERLATYDSITLHWVTDNRDLGSVRYNDKLLAVAGVDRDKLPSLCKATDIIGSLTEDAARALGLERTTRVIGGTPDVQSAVLGSGASRDFACHYYIGTSAWLSTHVPFKKTDIKSNMASLPAALPGRYFLANTQETAGACLNAAKAWLDPRGELSHDALSNTAANASAGSGKVLFLPWLYGERSPIADSLMRGGFINLSLGTTQADLVRAVLEGVAFNARWLTREVERFIGRDTGPINMIGGGARSELWCAIHADVVQRPVHQMAEPQLANVRGAGVLAAVATGDLDPSAIDALVPVAKVFEPCAEHRAIYDELFGAFMTSYKNNRKLMHRLNR